MIFVDSNSTEITITTAFVALFIIWAAHAFFEIFNELDKIHEELKECLKKLEHIK
jgi:hypothetical protein